MFTDVVAAQDAVLSVPTLRDYLRERLPDYMLPSAFVVLEVNVEIVV